MRCLSGIYKGNIQIWLGHGNGPLCCGKNKKKNWARGGPFMPLIAMVNQVSCSIEIRLDVTRIIISRVHKSMSLVAVTWHGKEVEKTVNKNATRGLPVHFWLNAEQGWSNPVRSRFGPVLWLGPTCLELRVGLDRSSQTWDRTETESIPKWAGPTDRSWVVFVDGLDQSVGPVLDRIDDNSLKLTIRNHLSGYNR